MLALTRSASSPLQVFGLETHSWQGKGFDEKFRVNRQKII